ncbi:hypothetical protein ACOM2C_00965 [Pseudarthrobacter sp. So.54]
MSGTTVKSASPVVPRWARKSTLVLAVAALALAVFGTTTQTWLTVHLDPAQLGQAVSSQDGLPVQGSKAATTVTALALVALVGGLAASIAAVSRAGSSPRSSCWPPPASSARPPSSSPIRWQQPRVPSRPPRESPAATCRWT